VVEKTSLVLPTCIAITGSWGIGAIDDNLGVMFVPVNLRPRFAMLQ
jgi:hypothetical protein